MKHLLVIVAVMAMGSTTGAPISLSSDSSRLVSTVEVGNERVGNRLCCGGPVCIPNEPCGNNTAL
jgi:hypothetical protein